MRLLSVVVCAGALSVAVFAFLMAGRHPAAVLPGLLVFGGAVATMALLYFSGGRNPRW